MSDTWQFYPCTVGDHAASIMLDTGISDSIKDLPFTLAKVCIHYKTPNENGLPTRDEYDAAIEIEDALTAFAEEVGDSYVGRVTMNGHRDFYVYTSRADKDWDGFVTNLARQSGYRLAYFTTADHGHQAYWNELYPSADDWRVINDMAVLQNLETHGDDGTASRNFDHWCYFENEAAAQPFIAWATSDRFKLNVESSGVGDDGQFCVYLQHHGVAELQELSSHTIALRRKAEEFGGDYDGWETEVMKTGDGDAQS
jgi:hypothetical protein